MLRTSLILYISLFLAGCMKETENEFEPVTFNRDQANRLAKLPLGCIQAEFPNKLGQTLGSAEDLASPKELRPAFYGCFDWHSAVHGHWSLVKLLRLYPDLEDAEEIKTKLRENISKEHMETELAFFLGKHNKSFERTYGWAWLLKLSQELQEWDDPLGAELADNLEPLTQHIAAAYINFLPKLQYPIRTGDHPNTAFGLSFAYDYAIFAKNDSLKSLIEQRSKDFYLKDKGCPMGWEPSGYDFLSPCLEETGLMIRVLPENEFKDWLSGFMPEILSKDFQLEPGRVGDRADGTLVHLDGLNFSRAWNLYLLAARFPEKQYLRQLADSHIRYSLDQISDENYEGTHWLGTFALHALDTSQK